jgi:hypothetical protein
VSTLERSLVILKFSRWHKVPLLGSCSTCQQKFLTPDNCVNDAATAQEYLQGKFEGHHCAEDNKIKTLRCPFCVEGGRFKAMMGRAGWFLCGRCGHIRVPGDSTFRCTCSKCMRPRR